MPFPIPQRGHLFYLQSKSCLLMALPPARSSLSLRIAGVKFFVCRHLQPDDPLSCHSARKPHDFHFTGEHHALRRVPRVEQVAEKIEKEVHLLAAEKPALGLFFLEEGLGQQDPQLLKDYVAT